MRDDIYYSILRLANCGVFDKIRPQKAATLPVAFLCVFLCCVWHVPYNYNESGGFRCKALRENILQPFKNKE